jgi:hypothetical protein
MAEAPSNDPATLWRDFVAQWEQGFNKAANEAMASDEYSRAMNMAMKAALSTQEGMGGALGRYLATLNLPSRSDLADINGRLQAIELRLEQIAAALQQGPRRQQPPATAMPPRTRRPARKGAGA